MSSPLAESYISLENLQREFLRWVEHWIKGRDTLEQLSADLHDILSLLKAIGFTNSSTPTDASMVVSHGIKLTVGCTTNNGETILVKPFFINECNCMDNSFWKNEDLTTAVYEPDLYDFPPKMTEQLRQVIQPVLNCLLNMLNGRFIAINEVEQAGASTKIETEFIRNTEYPTSRETDNVSPTSDTFSSDPLTSQVHSDPELLEETTSAAASNVAPETVFNPVENAQTVNKREAVAGPSGINTNSQSSAKEEAAKASGVSKSTLLDILKFIQSHPTEEGLKTLEAAYFILSRNWRRVKDDSNVLFCLKQPLISITYFEAVISELRKCISGKDD